jgi:radical SAM superfamily enzyme YgiQ (UPF0313 family)
MSSLGFLSVYSLAASRPDFAVERFFYSPGALPLSFESRRPLSDFPVIAASLSFENDYWILWDLLRSAGVRAPDEESREGCLIAAGGVALWANPFPLLPILDAVLTGEGELSFADFLDLVSSRGFLELPRREALELISSRVRGALVPELLPRDLRFSQGELFKKALASFSPVEAPRLPFPFPPSIPPPHSPIHTLDAEFSGMKLVEISRGCPYGCRFCLAGSLYRPHRPWPVERILQALSLPNPWDREPVFPADAPVGLVSAAAADHPGFKELLERLIGEGRRVSVSSLRLSALNPEIAALLARGRVKGVALAPEAGSQRLRDVVNKNMTENDILEAVKTLALAGVGNVKLYFMAGLPQETDDDLLAVRDLAEKILSVFKGKSRSPRLKISAGYFIPKPHTPFEDEPVPKERDMRRKGELLKKLLGPLPGAELRLASPAESLVQSLLSRGGPESFTLVDCMRIMKGKPKAALKFYGYREDDEEEKRDPEIRPWRAIRTGPGEISLAREKEKSLTGASTAPCPEELFCSRCQACETLENS